MRSEKYSLYFTLNYLYINKKIYEYFPFSLGHYVIILKYNE